MAKVKKNKFAGSSFESFVKEEIIEKAPMSLAEAKAHRASLHKPQVKALSDTQKREAFRIFWASNKKKYGKAKAIEKALWLHLQSIEMDQPEQFAKGLEHFGLKKVK
jgi:hypothetical protein